MFNFLMFSHQFTKENSPHQFTNCNWSGVFMRKSAFKNIYLFTFILVIYKKHTSCHSKYLFYEVIDKFNDFIFCFYIRGPPSWFEF